MTLWRIGTDAPDYEAHEISGRGAETSGGRWNQMGTPMLYTTTSRALACLETIVHLADEPLPLNRYLVKVTVPMAAWKAAAVVDPRKLVGWDAEPAGKASLDWGTNWAAAKSTLLARVPSIIVPEESNVLINPAHPDAADIRAVKVRKWVYDLRFSHGQRIAAVDPIQPTSAGPARYRRRAPRGR
jgi:RES domain-containing protein